MTDHVEAALVGILDQARHAAKLAKEAAELAKAAHDKRLRDVFHLEGLLAHHLKQVLAEPETAAWKVQPPAPVTMPDAPQGIAAWPSLVGTQVVVTYVSDGQDLATLVGIGGDHVTISVDGTEYEPTIAAVRSIVPAEAPVPELPAPAPAEQTGSHPLPTDTIREPSESPKDGAL
jgi:hypothetical protein